MRWFLGILMASGVAMAAMAAHPNFRENMSRWYIQVSFNANDRVHGIHYIGETWETKAACEGAFAASGEGGNWGRVDLVGLAESIMKQYGEVTDVQYFCGVGSWQNTP